MPPYTFPFPRIRTYSGVNGSSLLPMTTYPIIRASSGPVGSGNIAKLINQNIYLCYVAAFCESMRLGRSAGLDVQTLLDVLRKSVAGDPLMTGWEKRIETGDLEPGWRVRRVLKDMTLGADVASERAFDGPIFETALQAFRDIGEAGHMEHYLTALFTAVADAKTGPSQSK